MRFPLKHILACTVLAFGATVVAHAQPIVVKFSHVVADKTPKG